MYFLDSSALTKLFVLEKGTAELMQKLRSPQVAQKAISALTILEVRSALWRRIRAGDIVPDDGAAALQALEQSVSGMRVSVLSTELIDTAASLIERSRLRTLDALQLAAALLLERDSDTSFVFVASDAVLLESAAREGLAVWNPES